MTAYAASARSARQFIDARGHVFVKIPNPTDNGKKIAFNVKVGDKVLISKYGATEIKIDGENYLIMREDDILGIIG